MIRLVHVCPADTALILGASEHVRDGTAQWRFISLPLHMPGVWFAGLIQRWRNNVHRLKQETIFCFSLCGDPFKILINCLKPNILIYCSGLWAILLSVILCVLRSGSGPPDQFSSEQIWSMRILAVTLSPSPRGLCSSSTSSSPTGLITHKHSFLPPPRADRHAQTGERAGKQIWASSVGAGMDPRC